MEEVPIDQCETQPIVWFTKMSIVIDEQLQPQELISSNFVEYMTIQTTFRFGDYGITITIGCNSPKDGDNGHTQTTQEMQQQFHQQIPQV